MNSRSLLATCVLIGTLSSGIAVACAPMLTVLVSAALVVVAVHDGDTLTIAEGPQRTIIRLAEIDAPETHAALLASIAAQP